MIVIKPATIVTADLQSSIAIDADSADYGTDWQGEWTAGSYGEGEVVYKGVELYEALGTTSDDPEVGSVAETPTWLALGKVNRWRAFDEYVNTVSSATDEMVMILDVNEVDYLALFEVVANDLKVELLNYTALSNTAHWTISGSGTNEYYYTGTISAKPDYLEINDAVADEGTLGTLAAGEWTWGDNDTLGADTVYVRLSDGTDPDTKAAGYVVARDAAWTYEYDFLDAALDIGDWYEYFYAPYPSPRRDIVVPLEWMTSTGLGEKIRIELTGSGTIECGMCIVGVAAELGATQWKPTIGAIDYSRKLTDTFGRTYLNQGKFAKRVRGDLIIPEGSASEVYRTLNRLLGLACVWNFNEESTSYDPLIVYGFVEDYEETLHFTTHTTCSLSIQGLI